MRDSRLSAMLLVYPGGEANSVSMKLPLRMDIMLQDGRVQLETSLRVPLESWDGTIQRARFEGMGDDCYTLNDALDRLEAYIKTLISLYYLNLQEGRLSDWLLNNSYLDGLIEKVSFQASEAGPVRVSNSNIQRLPKAVTKQLALSNPVPSISRKKKAVEAKSDVESEPLLGNGVVLKLVSRAISRIDHWELRTYQYYRKPKGLPLRFVLRQHELAPKGKEKDALHAVWLSVHDNSMRLMLRTNIKLLPQAWDFEGQCVKDTARSPADDLNRDLGLLKAWVKNTNELSKARGWNGPMGLLRSMLTNSTPDALSEHHKRIVWMQEALAIYQCVFWKGTYSNQQFLVMENLRTVIERNWPRLSFAEVKLTFWRELHAKVEESWSPKNLMTTQETLLLLLQHLKRMNRLGFPVAQSDTTLGFYTKTLVLKYHPNTGTNFEARQSTEKPGLANNGSRETEIPKSKSHQ
jgi:hypothetical protein